MIAHRLLNPTTAAITQVAAAVQVNATEADGLLLIATGTALGAGETFTVNVIDSTNALQPFISPTLNAIVTLTAGLQTAYLPGGLVYAITKTVTASAAGLDVMYKPRTGVSGG